MSDSLVAGPAGAVIDSVIAQQLFRKMADRLTVGDVGATVTVISEDDPTFPRCR